MNDNSPWCAFYPGVTQTKVGQSEFHKTMMCTQATTTTAAVTATTTTTTKVTTLSPCAVEIVSGDTVFLKSHSGQGNQIEVSERGQVQARWRERAGWQSLVIMKEGDGKILAGDTVFFKTHLETFIDVEGSGVRARFSEKGTWQGLKVEKPAGGSAIRAGDVICLQAHTGNYIDVEDRAMHQPEGLVQARWQECGAWQKLVVQKDVPSAVPLGAEVFLKTHSGTHLDVGDGDHLQARWAHHGDWQKFVLETHAGHSIYPGDAIFLKSAHTGNHIHVDGDSKVGAAWHDQGVWQTLTLEKDTTGPVCPGDNIFLKAWTGNHIDFQGDAAGVARARWNDKGSWQKLVLESDPKLDIVTFTMRVESDHFVGMLTNHTWLSTFKIVVRTAVAKEAGADTLPEHVKVDLLRAVSGPQFPEEPSRRLLVQNVIGVEMKVEVENPVGGAAAVHTNLGSGKSTAQAVASKLSIAMQVPIRSRVLQSPQRMIRRAHPQSICDGATLTSMGHYAVLTYPGAKDDLTAASAGSAGLATIKDKAQCFYDLEGDFDGTMIFPFRKLPGFSNYNSQDSTGRPTIMFNTNTEEKFRSGSSGPFLHEVMHTWGVGLENLLDHPDGMPHGHWGMTADDSHGYLGGFPREAFKCTTHAWTYWSEDTWTGNPDRCPGARLKIDCEKGRTHHGTSELHRDQVARSDGKEPTADDLSVSKFSDFELLLMGLKRPEDIHGDLIHCKGEGHLCEREHYVRDTLWCNSLQQGKPFALIFASAIDVRDVIIRGGSSTLMLSTGQISDFKALERSTSVPTLATKSWLLYAISGNDLYVVELEVRQQVGDETDGRGSTRSRCGGTPSTTPGQCRDYTCDDGWVDKSGKATITCLGETCWAEECCQPPPSQPILVELKSLRHLQGYIANADLNLREQDVQQKFASMPTLPASSWRFSGLGYHQVLDTTCQSGVVVADPTTVASEIAQKVKDQQFTNVKKEFRFAAIVVKDPTDECRGSQDNSADIGLEEFGKYLSRSVTRFSQATRQASSGLEGSLNLALDGKCKGTADCAAQLQCVPPAFTCPHMDPGQGQPCQGNHGDSVWRWMADSAFGLGHSYHDTTRPAIDFSQVPHGTCLEFGCVDDWTYQNVDDWTYKHVGTRATLQCVDGAFTVVAPKSFQQNDEHKCKWS